MFTYQKCMGARRNICKWGQTPERHPIMTKKAPHKKGPPGEKSSKKAPHEELYFYFPGGGANKYTCATPPPLRVPRSTVYIILYSLVVITSVSLASTLTKSTAAMLFGY